MPSSTQSHIKHIIQWLAGSVAATITIIIPSEHLYTGYNYQTEITQAKANYIAEDLSQFVFKNPETWTYQDHRFSQSIEKYTNPELEKSSLILGINEIIYTNGTQLKTPTITISEYIYDANKAVASIQIQVSMRPILIETMYNGFIALLFGIIIYLTLYLMPMKALTSAINKLNETQTALQKEIADKEQALQEAHEMGQKLHEMAMHDSLTGLPNRTMYQDRLTQALSLAERQKTILAVVMIDLNRFKEINDSLGHHIGDSLLIEIAKRLDFSLRKCDTVARLGGDEFALVLHINDHKNAIDLCNKITQTIKTPVNIKQNKIQIQSSASCGIAYYPDDGIEAAHLLQKADIAMYAAKKTSTNISVYHQKLDTNTPEKLRLVNDLNQAISNNELFLVYQPKIDLNTLLATGVEALLRWQHPEDGLISPAAFIPLAEGSEIIHPLTDWVINTALEQQQKWKSSGINLVVSINVSGRNLRDDNFHKNISNAITKWGNKPEDIILEITESAMIDNPEHALTILQEISNQGIRLSIDDFGTGHASLVQLKTFPFDELKIDRSFVKDMITDAHDAAIVRSAIALAKSLNMTTVAEGIEDERMIELLKEMQCDMAQGFYFCKPKLSSEIVECINTNKTQS